MFGFGGSGALSDKKIRGYSRKRRRREGTMPKPSWRSRIDRRGLLVLPTLEAVAILVVGAFFMCAGIVMLQVGLDNSKLVAWLYAHPEMSGVTPAAPRAEWGDFGISVSRASDEVIHRFCMSFRAMCPQDMYALERVVNAQLVEGIVPIVLGTALLILAIYRIRPRGRNKPPMPNRRREQP